ncbi:hypothetical protein PoB_001875800 [Plakobranchus ocellatus]|uniref:Uncharacterized protein n=1 Tax=Plakobranchus ocellatus TaxID=259542 RepID=A0AAV3ZBZ4_9GAST|nr:hypothetical protein PoB_001875800 [Plakobranchus ocellatus]
MSTRNYIVLRDKDSNIDDSTVRNRWKWIRMDRIVQVREDHERLGLFIQKLRDDGRAYCVQCRALVEDCRPYQFSSESERPFRLFNANGCTNY